MILTLVANSAYSVKCLLLLLPTSSIQVKWKIWVFPLILTLSVQQPSAGARTRSGMQVLLPALQLQWRRGCADEFVWAWAWCMSLWDSSSSRAEGVRREGQGSGSGPSPPRVQHDRWAILWAKSWQSACVGGWDAPAGACWKWDPGAACWTDCFNGQFCQTRLKCLQESPGQELMKPYAFSGLIKLCSGEMMHTKLSSFFFPWTVTTMALLA